MRILSRNLAFLSRWWTRLRRWITAPATWWWSYFLGGFVRYMRTVQSYRHSSKNLTWSIFSEILPVRFKLTNSNNRNGTFTKNPSCFWNHTHTNVLSIQLILTPGFSYLQTVTRNKLVGIEKISLRSLNETIWWMTNSWWPGSFFFTTRDLLLMILSTGWSFSGSIFLIWSTLCRGFWLTTSDTFLLSCRIIAAPMEMYEA